MTVALAPSALEKARQEGAEKALFYVACQVEQLGYVARLEHESVLEWMGRYKALVEASIQVTADQIDAGRLSLRPLPKGVRS